MNSLTSSSSVISRLKQVVNVKTDDELAFKIGVSSKTTVSSWRTRDSVPHAICIQLAQENNIDLNWLLTGEGEMYRNGTKKSEQTNPNLEIITNLFNQLGEKSQRDVLSFAQDKKELEELSKLKTQFDTLITKVQLTADCS